MREYFKIAENTAEQLVKGYEKLLKENDSPKEVLTDMFLAFQEVNDIKYPYSHVDVSILVSYVKSRTDKQPTLREELILPPMVIPVEFGLHEVVHFTPALIEGLSLSGPAVVISVENYMYVKMAKSIVLGIAVIEREEDYFEYIKRAKEMLGAMTKQELTKMYEEKKANADDASAIQDKTPSEE